MPFAKSCAERAPTPLVLPCGSDPGQYHRIKAIELTNGTRHPIQISRRCACDREFTMLRLETERQYTQGSERAGEMRPGGFEPPTNSLEGCCSIHLSYGRRKTRRTDAQTHRRADAQTRRRADAQTRRK